MAQQTSIAAGLQRVVYVKMEKIVCQNTLLMEILLGYLVLYHFVILME